MWVCEIRFGNRKTLSLLVVHYVSFHALTLLNQTCLWLRSFDMFCYLFIYLDLVCRAFRSNFIRKNWNFGVWRMEYIMRHYSSFKTFALVDSHSTSRIEKSSTFSWSALYIQFNRRIFKSVFHWAHLNRLTVDGILLNISLQIERFCILEIHLEFHFS